MKADKLKNFIFVIMMGCILAVSVPGVLLAADTEDKKEISIDLLPGKVLFDVNNMKPGDWAPRDIVIQNNGKLDFDYFVSVQKVNDNNKLFNELILEVLAGSKELYNGKLKDFKELPARNLASMDEEELQFTIRFPEHLGNEFQGLQAQFSLLFTAEGEESTNDDAAEVSGIVGSGGGPQGAGLPLPDTATGIFTFLLIGAMLVFGGGLILLINKRVKQIKKSDI